MPTLVMFLHTEHRLPDLFLIGTKCVVIKILKNHGSSGCRPNVSIKAGYYVNGVTLAKSTEHDVLIGVNVINCSPYAIYSGNRLKSPRLRSTIGLHQQLISVLFFLLFFSAT